MTEGRVSMFNSGYEGVRNIPFRRTSVLDNLYPTPNGQTARELQHSMMGRRSEIGASEATAEQEVWVRR